MGLSLVAGLSLGTSPVPMPSEILALVSLATPHLPPLSEPASRARLGWDQKKTWGLSPPEAVGSDPTLEQRTGWLMRDGAFPL